MIIMRAQPLDAYFRVHLLVCFSFRNESHSVVSFFLPELYFWLNFPCVYPLQLNSGSYLLLGLNSNSCNWVP